MCSASSAIILEACVVIFVYPSLLCYHVIMVVSAFRLNNFSGELLPLTIDTAATPFCKAERQACSLATIPALALPCLIKRVIVFPSISGIVLPVPSSTPAVLPAISSCRAPSLMAKLLANVSAFTLKSCPLGPELTLATTGKWLCFNKSNKRLGRPVFLGLPT